MRRWQRRLDPVEKRLVGGCTFTRPIADLLTAAGFTIRQLDVFYQEGAPKFSGAASLGVAVSAVSAGSGPRGQGAPLRADGSCRSTPEVRNMNSA